MTGKRHRFLGRCRGRLRRRGRAARPAHASSSPTAAGASTSPSRSSTARCSTSTTPTASPTSRVTGRVVRTQQDLADRLPRLRRPAGHARDRGDHRTASRARAGARRRMTVRERNFYREGDTTPYGTGGARRRAHSAHLARAGRIEQLQRARGGEIADVQRDATPHRKRGLAITPVKFGISFTTSFFNQAGALVLDLHGRHRADEPRRHRDGPGAAHEDAADRRRTRSACRSRAVRLMPTSTDKVPNTSATAASSGSDLNGAAVKDACETLRARLAAVAARELGTSDDQIVFDDGKVFSKSAPERCLTFSELTHRHTSSGSRSSPPASTAPRTSTSTRLRAAASPSTTSPTAPP